MRPLLVVTFCEIGWFNVSVKPCVSVHLCKSVRNRMQPRYEMRRMQVAGEFFFLTQGSFFSHRAHRFNRALLRTVSNPQKAFGIQISQNVKTIIDTNKGQHKADILLIGVSRWSLPFPPGEGSGEGPLFLWAFVCLFICVNLFEIERTLAMRWDACNSLRSSFSHEGLFFLSQNSQILQSIIAHSFDPTEGLRHTEFTERYCYRRYR